MAPFCPSQSWKIWNILRVVFWKIAKKHFANGKNDWMERMTEWWMDRMTDETTRVEDKPLKSVGPTKDEPMDRQTHEDPAQVNKKGQISGFCITGVRASA